MPPLILFLFIFFFFSFFLFLLFITAAVCVCVSSRRQRREDRVTWLWSRRNLPWETQQVRNWLYFQLFNQLLLVMPISPSLHPSLPPSLPQFITLWVPCWFLAKAYAPAVIGLPFVPVALFVVIQFLHKSPLWLQFRTVISRIWQATQQFTVTAIFSRLDATAQRLIDSNTQQPSQP